MLRRNPQSGIWERKEGAGWVPAHNTDDGTGGMDVALDDVFSDTAAASDGDGGPTAEVPGGVGAPSAPGTARQSDEARAARAGVQDQAATQDLAVVPEGAAAGAADGSGDRAVDGGPADLDLGPDWDIPGLVSTDSPRSTRSGVGLRKRLQERAKGKRRAQGSGATGKGPVKVEVGPRAAKATGPAVKDSTESRQTRRRIKGAQPGDGGKPQRYVSKPPPALLGARPRWMQDLFEAHFRSEMTLGLRREHNRMKISRTDYAIGWLTLMDKLREDPSIARLKDGNGKA
jgi:hypothetical protein